MSLISSASSYGIRAIVYIATAEVGETDFVPTRRIAEELDVPSAFLSKVLQRLTRAGILVSLRGATGGVALGRSPSEITLLQIAESAGDDRPFGQCVLGLPTCSDESPCAMHGQWREKREGITALFADTTVAALVAENTATPAGASRQRHSRITKRKQTRPRKR